MISAKDIKSIAEGDVEAFERLYNELKRPIFATALSILRHQQEAEDIAVDTFLQIKKYAPDFRGGSVKAWAVQIARNLSLNRYHKRKREVFVDYTENESLYGEYRVEEDFAQRLTLNAALSTLLDEERQIVLMYNSGLKHREIAAALSLPIGTVTWKYNNALKKLKKVLSADNIHEKERRGDD